MIKASTSRVADLLSYTRAAPTDIYLLLRAPASMHSMHYHTPRAMSYNKISQHVRQSEPHARPVEIERPILPSLIEWQIIS